MPTLTGALRVTPGHRATLLLLRAPGGSAAQQEPQCGCGALAASSNTALLDECSIHSGGKGSRELGA